MRLEIMIIAADRASSEEFLQRIASPFAERAEILEYEPDIALRPLRQTDLVILGNDLRHRQVLRVLRALQITGGRSRVVAALGQSDDVSDAIHYLSFGVRGLISITDDGDVVREAAESVFRDRQYVSPALIDPLLRRYRELCAKLRASSGTDQELAAHWPVDYPTSR